MKRYLRGEVVAAAIALSIMAPAITDAQAAGSGVVAVMISGVVPVPVGQLVDNRNVGVGGIAGLRYAPAASSPFAIRLEVSGLLPSSHDNRLPNVTPQVANGSSAVFATAGPELDIPAASGRFYGTAAAGVAHIWATSSASNTFDTPLFGPFYTLTTRQATNFAWGGSGGFITPRSRSGLAGDISVRYYDLGRATYTTLYPSLATGQGNLMTKAFTTTGHHQTTFVAPSIGLSWIP